MHTAGHCCAGHWRLKTAARDVTVSPPITSLPSAGRIRQQRATLSALLSPRLSENVWQVGKGRARGQKAAFHPAFALWALALGFLLSSPFRFRRFSCNDHTTLATACGRLRRRRGSWTREPGSTRLRPNLRRLLKSAEGRDRGGGGATSARCRDRRLLPKSGFSLLVQLVPPCALLLHG